MAEGVAPSDNIGSLVRVRRAVRADTSSLERLWTAFMDEQAALDARLTPSPDATQLWRATLREAFETGAPVVLVAEVEGAIAGFVVLEDAATAPVYTAEPAVHVGELYVVPAHRRTGVARALLDATVAEAARAGARTMRFEVARDNAASHALVAAWGAHPLATTYTRDV